MNNSIAICKKTGIPAIDDHHSKKTTIDALTINVPLYLLTLPHNEQFNSTDFPADFLCSCNVVASAFVNLDVTMSSGSDGIPLRMLKLTAYSIAPNLTNVFNHSLMAGVFPAD